MTREEIIDGLKAVDKECGKHLNEGFAWMSQIINESIKALEQEPCEKHDSDYWINLLNLFSDDTEHICECQDARTEILNALLDKTCTDAISRQAVLDQVITIETDDYSGNEILDVIPVEVVKGLPPVYPAKCGAFNGKGGC